MSTPCGSFSLGCVAHPDRTLCRRDLVVFHQSLFHGVFGHEQGRSYIACKYASRPVSAVRFRFGAENSQSFRLTKVDLLGAQLTEFELASLWHNSSYAFRPARSLASSATPVLRRMVEGMGEVAAAAERAAAAEFPKL